jgi:hypothetical protein
MRRARPPAAYPAYTEHSEQVALIEWAATQTGRWPELNLLYAIPNGGARLNHMGGLKAEGLKAGVPDLCLPVARHGWHGLYIEMKINGARPRATQVVWLEALTEEGYLAVVCQGFEDARQTLEDYLTPLNSITQSQTITQAQEARACTLTPTRTARAY